MKKIFLSGALLLQVIFVFSQALAKYTELTKQAASLYESKQYKLSAQTYTKAFQSNGWKAYRSDRYNAACAWALVGNKDSAFYQLFKVADAFKYDNYDLISRDTVLFSLNKDKRWEQLLDIVKKNIGQDESKLNKALLKLLDSVYHNDQVYRFRQISIDKEYGIRSSEAQGIRQTIHSKDSMNEKIVSDLLDKYGWLGTDVVGENGNATIALVLQHATFATQQKYLPLMREAIKNKKADPYDLAIIEDKVALKKKRKQIYGTYLIGRENKKFYMAPIEDPELVDKRRAQIGLCSLDEYLKNWGMRWDVQQYKQDVEIIEKENLNY